MTIDIFKELVSVGLSPIPIIWDAETKSATSHQINHSEITNGSTNEQTLVEWVKYIDSANGIALKLFPPFFMVDFDLKNTDDKTIFTRWMTQVNAVNDEVLSKVCIEKTRNDGYHVHCKYTGIEHKQVLASSETGSEVISNYTGGLLSYSYPTPGYELVHNEFRDIQELTQDEYDTLNSISESFNKYKPEYNLNDHKVIEYPVEYESISMQFDHNCNEKCLEWLVNSIDLFEVKEKRYSKKDAHLAYLRKGSTASYSAKVYFKSNKVLLFTSSIPGFPSFHTRINEHDNSWILTPTRIIYYKCGANWRCAEAEIKRLSEQFDIQLENIKPIQEQYDNIPAVDRMKFPYDIFPKQISDFIECNTLIQKEYIAGAMLGAVSCAIGNSVKLQALNEYKIIASIYLAIVAPPGASKSPAMKKAFSVLEKYDKVMYDQYKEDIKEYNIRINEFEKDKNNKGKEKPEKPNYPQTLIKDSTIEMVIKILGHNNNGCAVYADELAGFLNRMGRYKDNDEVQKWLELWSGGTALLQRITRDVDRVDNTFCTIVGGIQPGVLEALSRDQNEHNGFFHRFLFIYPEPQQKPNWQEIVIPGKVKYEFEEVFNRLIQLRNHPEKTLVLSPDAYSLLEAWFNSKNVKYNKATDYNIKGIISKYQEYCLRFALIIEVINNERCISVSESSMDKAIRLTEYFFANIHKAMQILAPETPIDKLPKHQKEFYNELTQMFTMKTAKIVADKYNIKENTLKAIINRGEGKIFKTIKRGEYEKLY